MKTINLKRHLLLPSTLFLSMIILVMFSPAVFAKSKQEINILADATIERFKEEVTGGQAFLSGAAAVLVFPQVLKAGLGVDGSVAVIKWGVGEDINTLDIKDPVVGFVFSNKGLMFNLTLEGSKFTEIKR